ncbi:MAG TPA: hypothetical protein GXX18_13690 [Bacillales bacterium]|nr:hypothetical protein [Bacillales bacterium]
MVKKILIILVFLLIIIAGLTGYQWLMYDKLGKTTERVQTENLEIEAELVHKDGELSITQTVSKLGQDSFLIEIPRGVKDFECHFGNGENCEIREDSNYYRIPVGSETLITFKYSIPFDEGKNDYWLENGFVQLFSNNETPLFGNFTVTILEDVNKSNRWFSGALSEVHVDKEHISYFAWTKKDTKNFPLYMSKAQLNKIEGFEPHLSLFLLNSTDEEVGFTNNWHKQLHSRNGLTIVQSNSEQVYIAPLLVVIPKDYNVEKWEELAIQAYLQNYKKPDTQDIEWVWNVLPSFILDRPTGEGKELEMSKELLENLQPESKNAFASWLLKQNKDNLTGITLADLDKQLSELCSLKVIFFEKNESKNSPFVPLYFIDQRKVFFGNKEVNLKWNAVIKNNDLLFPFQETLEITGFDINVVTELEKYEVMKDEKRWTFSLEEGTSPSPLELIGEELYISENGLEKFLNIEVIKRNEGIYLR